MPHIHVSMYPGTSEAEKQILAKALQKVLAAYGTPSSAISVCLHEVAPENWKDEVYDAYIKDAGPELYVAPGYTM